MRVNTAKDFSNLLLDGTHLQRQLESGEVAYRWFVIYSMWFKWVSLNLAVTEMYQSNATRLFQLRPKAAPL